MIVKHNLHTGIYNEYGLEPSGIKNRTALSSLCCTTVGLGTVEHGATLLLLKLGTEQ